MHTALQRKLGFLTGLLGVLHIFTLFSGASGWTQQIEEWQPEKLGNVLESTLVRYYVFGITNPEEFQRGEVPQLEEVGPFTYREKRVKQNLSRLNESTLQYEINWSMHFIPELTGEGLDENKTRYNVINLPFVTLADGLARLGLPKNFNNILVDEVVEAGEKLYREVNFGDSTFYGYNVSIYTDILDDVSQGQTEEKYPELANGKFAFYKNKNATTTSQYIVESTKTTPFGRILSYNGYENLGFWQEHTKCDNVRGYLDMFTFPKHISKETILDVFIPENCRTMRLEFVQEDVFRGIPVFVFKFPLEQFSNSLDDSETACYCFNFANNSNPQCLDYGLIDYAGCSKGAPLVGSFPHFLHANPRLLKNVKGVMPNKSLHESEVMIEPITGTPLYAVRRFQLNAKMRPIPSVTYFENMTERVVPLAWFENILEVPSTTFTAVKEKLERLKQSTEKDIYQLDQSPVEEVGDNTLRFASRSGMSGEGTKSLHENAKNVNERRTKENSSDQSVLRSISSISVLNIYNVLTCSIIGGLIRRIII